MKLGSWRMVSASLGMFGALAHVAEGRQASAPTAAESAPAEQAPAQEPAVEPADKPAEKPAPPPKGIQWATGDFTWKVGGYFKVDLIHDLDEIGSTDSFDPRTIPTGSTGLEGENTRIHARQTRFNLDVRGPSPYGEFRGFFEGDFFSDQNGFRMRHAYGSVGSWLGGQTWSTFMDEEAMPETIDFESPIAFPLVRQAQVRYTHPLEGGSYWAVALEDPDSDVVAPAVAGDVAEPLPDLNARYFWKLGASHVQVGGFAGMARFDPVAGSPDDEFLWGFNLSTKVMTWGQDNAMAQFTFGDGVGRYRGGVTAAPDASGDLEAISTWGVMLSYQHHWTEVYRSTLCYSWAEADLPAGAAATSTEALSYLAANFIWQFWSRAWTGIEYLYGTRDTFDGEDGAAGRLQVALRFDI